jgi:enoyl-CoA hydratase/carnithine racemase
MDEVTLVARRDIIKAAARSAAAVSAVTATSALAQQSETAQQSPGTTAAQPTSLGEITIERRGHVALFGLNRQQVQNRIAPETFQGLAKAIYDYDHDPSLRVAILFGHGDCFSRGIDVEAYRTVANSGGPLAGLTNVVNPLNYGVQRTKPLIAAVHGDTWNLAHELFLSADIRVAAANTNFGQDESSHGRFPGGGATVRFVREAGWGNAMRYMLTGDHWTAQDAYRMGLLQEIAETPRTTIDLAVAIANKVAACAPLGVQTTLASAHLAIDSGEGQAFSKLGAQYGALYRTEDFVEGLTAQAQGRPPIFRGN